MSRDIQKRDREQGNAVALTLLGLAVAILAGVIVLYFIGKSSPRPTYTPAPVDEETFESDEDASKNAREGWGTYINETYGFAFEYPSGWVVATGTLVTGEPVISVYPAITIATTTTMSPKDATPHVSVYPLGSEVELTEGFGALEASTVIIQTPQASAKDYVLNTNRPWATKAVFDLYPPSWTDSGFVFARAVVEEEEVVYIREGEEVTQEEFDPSLGDKIERSGFVDSNIRQIQEEILRSFTFETEEEVSSENSAEIEAEPAFNTEGITITSPEYGEIISSPLSVRGELTGFIDGDISVQLTTADGVVLAEVPVVPLGVWGNDDLTPFEVSVVFNTTTATSGMLVFEHANSSLVPAGETRKKVVPVVFDAE